MITTFTISLLLAGNLPISTNVYRDNLLAAEKLFLNPPAIEEARQYLSSISPIKVRTSEGVVVTVHDGWLETELQAYIETKDEELRQEIAYKISKHLGAMEGEVHPEEWRIRDQDKQLNIQDSLPRKIADQKGLPLIQRILEGEAYQRQRRVGDLGTVATQLRKTLHNLTQRMEQRLIAINKPQNPDYPAQKTGYAIYWIFLLGAFLISSLLLVWVWKALARATHTEAKQSFAPPDLPTPAPEPNALATEARKFAGTGDYRLAMRCLYWGILGSLHQQGRIEYKKERTNGQYLQDLSGKTEQTAFSEAAELFDRKWYGHEHCTVHEFTRMQQIFERWRSKIQGRHHG